ncbi:MAG: hypothetical protein H6981_07320 [Gammaproteobacteria bacterium]|nr:hypothetical protein [Gammaproteobacteria bacterium]
MNLTDARAHVLTRVREDLGTDFSYTPLAGGDPVTARGVFRSPNEICGPVRSGQGGQVFDLMLTHPTLSVLDAVAVAIDVEVVTVAAVDYRIHHRIPDNRGRTILVMSVVQADAPTGNTTWR